MTGDSVTSVPSATVPATGLAVGAAAFMVYHAVSTALLTPSFTAIALIAVAAVIAMGLLYLVPLAVGVAPFIV